MKTDKELKKWFKPIASKDPDKYYATDVLKKEGFIRKHCKCGTWFWTVNSSQEICGDPACQGGTNVVKDNPAKNKLSYIEVWEQFKKMFSEWDYTPIARYPVVARWNPTTDFTIASIAAFQPFVISGEVEPPAKKLVIPQFCLRFGDIDNVGITGAHCTGFVMIGQHQFVSPDEWSQNDAFSHIYKYITEGVGLPKSELTLHEDAWAGGGNYGSCMEFFSRGVELFNQVYMLFEHHDTGDKELKIKVLDMGLGMERIAWFSQGTPTVYDAIFPEVLDKLKKKTNVAYDAKLFTKFSPYSALLNIDEVDDINAAWESVGEKMGMKGSEVKEKILPMTALYSVAEHSRALLVALSDGALPSNVGGGYNLRVILRRALGFIDQFKWDVDLCEVVEWHAEEMKELFPELSENLSDVQKILSVEKNKYLATKEKAAGIVSRLMDKEITTEMLLELYDSNGISPETIRDAAKKEGKLVVVPDDFYMRVAELHEQKEKKLATKKDAGLDLHGLPDTELLYWGDPKQVSFEATVLKVIGSNVVLDKTGFYPTSGGQMSDVGEMNGVSVVEVFKQGPYIVHKVADGDKFKERDTVSGKIDLDRRMLLAVHHTATHVVNGAARKVLGTHVWQSGAAKTLEKARLDITHYDSLTSAEMKEIEQKANDLVKKNVAVTKTVMPRREAEDKYGFGLYQGGAVPGRNIRVVSIDGWDTEACGGTHLDSTGEIGEIKLVKSSKLQDGIVRLEFVAGKTAAAAEEKEGAMLDELAKLLGVKKDQLPDAASLLFKAWKKRVKKKKELDDSDMDFKSAVAFSGTDDEIVAETAKLLKTQPAHLENSIKKFLKEIDEKSNN